MEESKSHVSSKDHNKVRRFYFVKIRPFEDPLETSKIIKWAEELIKKLEQEKAELRHECGKIWTQYDNLCHYSPRCREIRIIYRMGSTRERLLQLQEQMKDLSFKKHECSLNGGEIFSGSSCLGEPNIHGLRFCMLHGKGNLAKEKKLLREMADAALMKGEKVNPWTSKRAILREIKLVNKEMEELKEENSELMEKRRIKEERKKSIRKRSSILSQKINEIDHKIEEAGKYILSSREQHENMNANVEKYLSLMNNVKELVQRKDVAALEDLSRREVDKFMYRWNHSKAFRESYYEIIVLPSLNFRGLTKDGGRVKR